MANLSSIHERNLSLKIWCHCLLQEYYGENVLHMSAVAEDPSVVKVGIAVHLFPPCHALFCSQLSFRSSSAVSFVLANCLLFFFTCIPYPCHLSLTVMAISLSTYVWVTSIFLPISNVLVTRLVTCFFILLPVSHLTVLPVFRWSWKAIFMSGL